MLCRSYCALCNGIEAITITVEVDVSKGINFFLVGLPDSAVRESLQRISTALKSVGARIPGKKITVNLAPADVRKEGSSYDLAIAIAILAASGQYNFPELSRYLLMGELALDGSLRGFAGALPIALHAAESSFAGCIFPRESAYEASEADNVKVYGADTIEDVINMLLGKGESFIVRAGEKSDWELSSSEDSAHCRGVDFEQIKGQQYVKRALEIAAAGGHNILMIGPPGSGKSLLAQSFPTILPPLTREEAIESTVIYSVAGKWMGRGGLLKLPPFRSPHYSSSPVAIIGGGSRATPGEISLAHNGVLYLDELPEFSSKLLEMLRQPMEDGVVSISRARYKVEFPSNFMLIASMNPCPCGFYGTNQEECNCQTYRIARYMARVSGPLFDRIDIRLNVMPISGDLLIGEQLAESSAAVKERVVAAREIQYKRSKGGAITNANLAIEDISTICKLNKEGKELIRVAIDKMALSARGFHKVLKIARTIADLGGSNNIEVSHLAEAIQYRGTRAIMDTPW